MDKRTEFSTSLKNALKKKDKIATSTIRLILAALKDRDIATREHGKAEGLEKGDILLMLQTMIKQRQESSKTYSKAGRDDLAEREEAEIDVIRTFMPKQLDDSGIEEALGLVITEIGAASIKDMGKVMEVMRSRYAGQVDMSKAGAAARKKLA